MLVSRDCILEQPKVSAATSDENAARIFAFTQHVLLTEATKPVNCDFGHGSFSKSDDSPEPAARRGGAGLSIPATGSRLLLWAVSARPLGRKTSPRHCSSCGR